MNASLYNFQLQNGSPCIDTGDPATPEGKDFLQTTVPLDGNNDGTVRADIGAHEYGGPHFQPLASPRNLKAE